MRVLGIDPGPQQFAWAVVDVRGARAEVVAVGSALCRKTGTLAVLEHGLDHLGCLHVAIERPRWYHASDKSDAANRAIGANLIETNYFVGRLAAMAEARGARVYEMTAEQWRKRVLGDAQADDPMIRKQLPLLVTKLGTTTEHERDAVGVALCLGRAAISKLEGHDASTF